MAPGQDNDPIVRLYANGGPTGEGTTYVTKSGARWRSDPSGCVVGQGNVEGHLVGGGKFGPTHVRGRP